MKSSLDIHISVVHEGRNTFACNVCKKDFSQKTKLDEHNLLVHEKTEPSEEYFSIKNDVSIENENFERKNYDSAAKNTYAVCSNCETNAKASYRLEKSQKYLSFRLIL